MEIIRVVSKEEAHKLIDAEPGNKIMILSFVKESGISDNGKFLKKKKCKNIVEKSGTIILSSSFPIMKLDLHEGGLAEIEKEDIVKSILLSKWKKLPMQK